MQETNLEDFISRAIECFKFLQNKSIDKIKIWAWHLLEISAHAGNTKALIISSIIGILLAQEV